MCRAEAGCTMMESHDSHSTNELVAYHRVKRRFLNLKDIEKEDMNELTMCEFKGQDFEFVSD